MEIYAKPTVTTLLDPHSLQAEPGLTGDELVKLTEKHNWLRREVTGRWWIGQEDYKLWLASGQSG